MFFLLVPPRMAISQREPRSIFALRQDFWNDYGYRTQYHLYYLGSDNNKQETLIGTVKILKKGQTDDMSFSILEDFDSLPEDFISIGQSLDYYQRISKLEPRTRHKVLSSLNDLINEPDLAQSFKNEPGWEQSLFRDFSESDKFLPMARSIIANDFTAIIDKNLDFVFEVTGWDNPVRFNFNLTNRPVLITRNKTIMPPPPYTFNSPKTIKTQEKLPNRITVIIGRNGSGKSTLLARLARVAHATPRNRLTPEIRSLGSLTPKNLGFTRIITVSYSAFDSFRLPGIKPNKNEEPDERLQIIKDVKEGTGRFVFCGLRDIVQEYTQQINEESDPADRAQDRLTTTLLKPIEVLAEEFATALKLALQNNKIATLVRALKHIVNDPSFKSDSSVVDANSLYTANPKELFLGWSTGHKIVMQILVHLAAHTTSSSLVLIDEPETHLHPPLLAALMHAIRSILEDENAFAVVATHSPIVSQETLVRHTYLIRREGSTTKVFTPSIETFGANINELTDEIFGLNSESTDFYKTLDKLIAAIPNLDEIENLFYPYGLSMQSRAYVMSRLAKLGR